MGIEEYIENLGVEIRIGADNRVYGITSSDRRIIGILDIPDNILLLSSDLVFNKFSLKEISDLVRDKGLMGFDIFPYMDSDSEMDIEKIDPWKEEIFKGYTLQFWTMDTVIYDTESRCYIILSNEDIWTTNHGGVINLVGRMYYYNDVFYVEELKINPYVKRRKKSLFNRIKKWVSRD